MNATLTRNPLSVMTRIKQQTADAVVLSGDEVPAPALNDFYDQVFPARADFLKRNWRWLYRTTCDTTVKSPIVVMKDGRVAGHVGMIPLPLRRGLYQRTAVWVCDIAVSPEYRGKTVGGILLAEAMAACPLRIGFPNEQSWKLITKFGWKGDLDTFGLSLLLRPERHPKLRDSSSAKPGMKSLAPLAGLATRILWRARTLATGSLSCAPVTDVQLAAFEENQSPAALHVARSREFLNWRIAAHPNRDAHFVLATADGKASAIARIVADGDCRRLHLLTMKLDPFESRKLSKLLAGIVRWALAEQIDVITAVTSDPDVVRVARWWLPMVTPLRYAYHADDPASEAFLSGAGRIWEYLDGDFDLTYLSPENEINQRSFQCA